MASIRKELGPERVEVLPAGIQFSLTEGVNLDEATAMNLNLEKPLSPYMSPRALHLRLRCAKILREEEQDMVKNALGISLIIAVAVAYAATPVTLELRDAKGNNVGTATITEAEGGSGVTAATRRTRRSHSSSCQMRGANFHIGWSALQP